jgi:hypothetical protein
MSYLSEPTSTTEYGVVKVGNFIQVSDGVISLLQDLSPTADVEFSTVSADELLSYGKQAVTSVTPAAGIGISIDDIIGEGTAISFTVNNTGVTSLNAGAGISIDNSTGDITISSTGADIISVIGVTTNYTATSEDEYIGVDSTSATTITLPAGENGRVYIIKDERGQGSGKITIQPQPGELIDNKTNYVIGIPFQSVSMVFRGSQWRII